MQTDEKPIYEFEMKPSFLETLYVSNIAMILKPIGFFFIGVYSLIASLIIFNNNHLLIIAIATFLIFIIALLLVELIVILKLFLCREKIILKTKVQFFETYLKGEKQNYNSEVKYVAYNKFNVFGDKVILLSKEVNITWFKIPSNIDKTEFVNFLKLKIHK